MSREEKQTHVLISHECDVTNLLCWIFAFGWCDGPARGTHRVHPVLAGSVEKALPVPQLLINFLRMLIKTLRMIRGMDFYLQIGF